MDEVEQQMRMLARLAAERNETAIRAALCGARILDVHMEPIKNRKTLYCFTIKTNAEPVMVVHPTDLVASALKEDSLPDRAPVATEFDLSTIRVKVKLG